MKNTIAVTGSEGFIASHLVEALVQRGHSVRAMVQYNSFSSAGWLDKMSPDVLEHVDIVMGDVRDHRSVMDLTAGVDAVLVPASRRPSLRGRSRETRRSR